MFYKHVLDREWNLKKLPRPRKQKSLPKVISPDQISLLIEKAAIFKHKVFITLLYSTGLRLGEALNLRVEDIEASAMRIRVNDGKGNKDRYTLLSLDLLDMLRFYFRAFRPQGGWVFNGKYRGKKWSQKGAQHSIVEARRRANLPEFVTAHVIRHCFATHLLQNGTDLVAIQQLMGHKYLKTTAQYIHLDNQHFTKITNPSDRIDAWEKVINSVNSSAIPAGMIGIVGSVADWQALGLNAPPDAASTLPWVVRYLTNPWVATLGLGAVAAAVMSSVDSSILSASSLASWNVYRPLIKPQITTEKLAKVIQKCIWIIGVTATVLALNIGSVYELWFLCSDFVYCLLFPPLVCALFDKKSNTYGAIAGFLVAFILRFGGGDPTLGLPILIEYPMIEDGVVLFPFRTLAMISGLVTIVVISRVFKIKNAYQR
ncbi:tyrosine-type recombinase/integrase [bacterium]|nr:tyrosine-type recombinase/integrase [bacterium]